MNRRIAKKMVEENSGRKYSVKQILTAARKLGIFPALSHLAMMYEMGVDPGIEGGDQTVVTVTPAPPVNNFHFRTGNAPSHLPGALTPGEVSMMSFVTIPADRAPAYASMSLPDLKDAAKAKGLKGYSAMKKAELVALLEGE